MEHPPRPPLGPHVVLLGAGASRAAFPNGDRAGRLLPLMDDVLEVLDLRSVFEGVGPIEDTNFESVYSKLAEDPRYEKIRGEVERRVADYFSSLELPDEATIYDTLLLSRKPNFEWAIGACPKLESCSEVQRCRVVRFDASTAASGFGR